MDSKEVVQNAKESFEKILLNEKYSSIIKDDKHLELLLSMLPLKKGSGCNVTGIDIAEKVIIQNQAKAEEQHISNLHFCSFDGINYPFANNSMNIITSFI